MMKKVGYKAEQAAAIEAVASTGGLFVPPVMGSVAFVMSGFTGVPYIKICAMAIIPSILYYLCTGMYVQFNAMRLHLGGISDEDVDFKVMFGTSYLFVIPFAMIIGMLITGFSLRITTFCILIMTFILSMLRKSTRGSVDKWLDACVDGARSGVLIAVSGATIGILLGALEVTGLAIKFPTIVANFSGGNLLVGLFLTALVCVILGCGVPPFATYITAAMLCVPALVSMGAPLLAAHFFILFLAALGQITPPVAVTCFVAAPIAGASFIKTCYEACRVSFIAWFLAFFMVYIPGILLLPGDVKVTCMKITAIVVIIFTGQSAFLGYYFWGSLSTLLRFVHLAAMFAMFYYTIWSDMIMFLAGMVIAIASTVYCNVMKHRTRLLGE
jgi:TRAP transporter 4TM/12TM fusion protein